MFNLPGMCSLLPLTPSFSMRSTKITGLQSVMSWSLLKHKPHCNSFLDNFIALHCSHLLFSIFSDYFKSFIAFSAESRYSLHGMWMPIFVFIIFKPGTCEYSARLELWCHQFVALLLSFSILHDTKFIEHWKLYSTVIMSTAHFRKLTSQVLAQFTNLSLVQIWTLAHASVHYELHWKQAMSS